MTQEEICQQLLTLGFREYPSNRTVEGSRSFHGAQLAGIPDCACNDKPPALYVHVYPDTCHNTKLWEGEVEFGIHGEAGDRRWLSVNIYSVKREEVVEFLPDAEAAARALWTAFVSALAHREARSSRRQEVAP